MAGAAVYHLWLKAAGLKDQVRDGIAIGIGLLMMILGAAFFVWMYNHTLRSGGIPTGKAGGRSRLTIRQGWMECLERLVFNDLRQPGNRGNYVGCRVVLCLD
jgi:hypothetical protein